MAGLFLGGFVGERKTKHHRLVVALVLSLFLTYGEQKVTTLRVTLEFQVDLAQSSSHEPTSSPNRKRHSGGVLPSCLD